MIQYEGMTRSQWEALISGYTFADVFGTIMRRLYPNSKFEYGLMEGLNGEALYDVITPYQTVAGERAYDTKLLWVDVDAELEKYKAEETKKIDLRFRVYGLYNWAQAASDAGVFTDYTNQELLINDIIEQNLETDLLSMESADDALRLEGEFQQGVQQTKVRIAFGQDIIATINYMNAVNAITANQSFAILGDIDIKHFLEALQVGALETAQALMAAKDLTGLAPMDQTYKDRIDSMINTFLEAESYNHAHNVILEIEKTDTLVKKEYKERKKQEELDHIFVYMKKALDDTAWSMLADAPLSSDGRKLYQNYRQYVRDVPELWQRKQITKLKVMTFDEWRYDPPIYKIEKKLIL